MATYDIEALKADLPTAKELAQFVFDKTNGLISLDLIGKPKDDQYQVAKNALEGKKIPTEFVTGANPYMDKKDEIPEDPLRVLPPRDPNLPDPDAQVHFFGATNMPHPLDPQSDKKVYIEFRKYENGMITYTITGPIEQVPMGEKKNRYGQTVPEKYTWIDPRTPETIMRNADGTFTKEGRGLHTYCVGEKGSGIWSMIDRDMVTVTAKNIANPWA
ncbi:hypothetical protein UFOVP996_32 [uncultured Caudovirales phage]|uniref:Uncharacterized protein n=1 Tax=uncultured Caudovirales phage TaxID=2100421 RepID=A0A6J5Q325_9CAUD|nr:hypothetical protein UFOVP996_32 [uncultured Caudovirales phage]